MNLESVLRNIMPLGFYKVCKVLNKRRKEMYNSEIHIEGVTSNKKIKSKIIYFNKDFLSKSDCVKIRTYMYYENSLYKLERYKYQYSEYLLNSSIDCYEVNFNNYGSWIIEIEYTFNNHVIHFDKDEISVFADSYNIAYLNATYPVLTFISMMKDITNSKCPTIIFFERSMNIDFFDLPENVYLFPLISSREIRSDLFHCWQHSNKKVSQYIKLLHNINNKSHFNLYIVDNHNDLILDFFYCNRINEDLFSTYILSDGTGTYDDFNFFFCNDKEDKYNKLLRNIKLSKIVAKEVGLQDSFEERYYDFGDYALTTYKKWIMAYAFIWTLVNVNVHWIVKDKRYFNTFNEQFNSNVIEYDTGLMIKEAISKDKLYCNKILANCFSEIDKLKSSKPLCLLIGSDVNTSLLIKYVKKTLKLYGSQYEYIYKGHPGIVERKKIIIENKLRKLGIKIIDRKIPAELILVKYPDTYICGYKSSCFMIYNTLNDSSNQFLTIWDNYSKTIIESGFSIEFKNSLDIEKHKVIIS